MNLRSFALAAITLLLTAAPRVDAQTSTPPDDHKNWAEVTHKLEAAPLDESLNLEVGVTIAEIATSGLQIRICQDFYRDFTASTYVHHEQIRWLYMLAAATYQAETGKTDTEGTNLYALHSVLKGYSAILKQEPAAKDKMLDGLANADAKGKLPEVITQKNCNNGPALAALR